MRLSIQVVTIAYPEFRPYPCDIGTYRICVNPLFERTCSAAKHVKKFCIWFVSYSSTILCVREQGRLWRVCACAQTRLSFPCTPNKIFTKPSVRAQLIIVNFIHLLSYPSESRFL